MALIQVGAAAAAFSLRDQHGSLRALDDYRGHFLVLWWYPKADTPG